MTEEFKPYEPEDTYQAVLTEGEAFTVQEIRKIKFGSVKVLISGGKITRLETISSELMEEKKKKDKVVFDIVPQAR